MVSHDLRSPLCSISGFLQVVLEDSDTPAIAAHREFLKLAFESAQKLTAITEELLDTSRLRTGKIRPKERFIKPYGAVQEVMACVAPLAEKKGINLLCDIPQNTTIFTDSRLLAQVLQNLASNAIKFCKEGDTVSFFVPAGKIGTIAVKDTGPGIKEGLKHNIFKYEESSSTLGTSGEKGTGLGLPWSFEIMEALGGSLEFESEPEKGTVFYARLPLGKPVILVVDDSTETRFIVRNILKQAHMDIHEAENGKEALEGRSGNVGRRNTITANANSANSCGRG